MNSSKLLVCADANEKIGIGHFMRSLAIACEWQKTGGKVIWVSDCKSPTLLKRLEDSGMELERCPEQSQLLELICLLKPDWALLDGYHFDELLQLSIRNLPIPPKLLIIDDSVRLKAYHADILLNPNLQAEHLGYSTSKAVNARKFLGIRYNLLRPEFLKYEKNPKKIHDKCNNILVTMGGADPENHTHKILHFLLNSPQLSLDIRIALGPSNPHRIELQSAIHCDPRFTIIETVENMPEEMLRADLAITAGGSTCWEMAFLQLPMIVLDIAENQKTIAQALAKQEIAIHLGTPQNLTQIAFLNEFERLRKDSAKRSRMAKKGREFIDGQGVVRVVEGMYMKTD